MCYLSIARGHGTQSVHWKGSPDGQHSSPTNKHLDHLTSLLVTSLPCTVDSKAHCWKLWRSVEGCTRTDKNSRYLIQCPLSLGNSRSPYGYINQRLEIEFLSSWWWAVCRSKHVEPLKNFWIINSSKQLRLVGYFYMICTMSSWW